MLLKKIQTVDFDPANPEHRLAVASFMKRTAWSDSKFRFSHDPAYGSVADQVKIKMLHWYIQQDTGIRVAPATRPLIGRSLGVLSMVV